MKDKKPSDSETITTQIILPDDTNPMGIVQGGKIVQLMDLTAAICAQTHCTRVAVTASIDKVFFLSPARVGDILKVRAVVTRVFNSSMEIYCEVTCRRLPEMRPVLCNTAYFTFVALGDDQKPVSICAVKPETEEEIIRFGEALARKKQWAKRKGKKEKKAKIANR